MPEVGRDSMSLEPVEALQRVIAGTGLNRGQMATLMDRLMGGELDDAFKAGLLTALAAKGETAAEIAGAVDVLRRRVVPIPHSRERIVDTCGTGGDGKGTFNVSTAAALVAAAVGAAVAKHGNRSVSSRCGSADVLEALGVRVESDPQAAGRCLDEIGICFLFAPEYHPAMREVMPVRRALGVRTIFNLLGPLTNPAGARRQLLGVYAPHLVELVATVLAELGAEAAMVVHGEDGLDELTTTGSTQVAEVREGRVRSYKLDPEALGLARARPDALAGGDPQENAALMVRVLEGESGALSDITVLNAGAALFVAGEVSDLADGVQQARGALDNGAAQAKLEQLREVSLRGEAAGE